MSDRQFKGVWIAAEIWLDTRLTLVERALLAEIDSFTGNGKSFRKTNDTIQEEYGISRNTVGRSLKKLQQLGYIEITFNGRVRYVTTRAGSIPKLGRQHPQNGEAASPNDTSTNTIERNKDNTLKKGEVKLPFEEKEFKEMWEVWLQERKDRRYRKFTQRGEQAALHDLYKISNQNHETAIAIIKQSIAKGWQGLHPVKGNTGIKLDPTATLKWANQ